jgi:hypothetical protein
MSVVRYGEEIEEGKRHFTDDNGHRGGRQWQRPELRGAAVRARGWGEVRSRRKG